MAESEAMTKLNEENRICSQLTMNNYNSFLW